MQIVTSNEHLEISLKNKSVHSQVCSNGLKQLQRIHSTYIIVYWGYIYFYDVQIQGYAHFKDRGAGLVTKCHADFASHSELSCSQHKYITSQ